MFLLRMGYLFLLLFGLEVRLNHEVLSVASLRGVLLLEVADETVLLLGNAGFPLQLILRLRLLGGLKVLQRGDGCGLGVGGGRFETKLRAS